MLIETQKIGESLRFNRKLLACLVHINEEKVTFKTTLACGRQEVRQGGLGELITLADKIKLRVIQIDEACVNATLLIVEPKNMVVCRV